MEFFQQLFGGEVGLTPRARGLLVVAGRIDKKNRRGAEGGLVSRWWLVCGIKNSAEQSVCYNVGVLIVVCNADVLWREYKSNFVTICPLLEGQQWKSHSHVESS